MFNEYTYMFNEYTYMFNEYTYICLMNIHICLMNIHICLTNTHICLTRYQIGQVFADLAFFWTKAFEGIRHVFVLYDNLHGLVWVSVCE